MSLEMMASIIKYKKTHQFVRRKTTKNQIEPDEDGLPELRPKIDFHKFLKQSSHDIRRIQEIG